MTVEGCDGARRAVRFWHSVFVGVAVFLCATAAMASSTGQAAATPHDFYALPTGTHGQPGDIVRSQSFDLALSVPGQTGPLPASAQRIMYWSNDTHGQPTVVTGTYLKPTLPWRGPGPRPLIAVAPGTYGQGDQCAPSKLFGELIHYRPLTDLFVGYESITANVLLAQGMAVVMTDYHGLGTAYVHDYLNRQAEAHAVLDSARAALHLAGSGLTPETPVAIFGFSQGGGGAAAAAELQSRYAGELKVVGSYTGGTPADLRRSLASPAVDGGLFGGRLGGSAQGLIGFVLNGIYADYPQTRGEIDAALNATGHRMLREVAGMCVGEMAVRYMFRPSTMLTTTGRSAGDVIATHPALRAAIDAQRIGHLRPGAPVLVAGSNGDDVLPIGQIRQMAADWCAQGATVQFERTTWIPTLFPSTATGHGLAFMQGLSQGVGWVNDRLAGKPAPSNCSRLP